jgi:hypothetical protein
MNEIDIQVSTQPEKSSHRIWIIPIAIVLFLVVLSLFSAFVIFWGVPNVIRPAINYMEATALIYEGKYSEAIEAFEKLGDYRDSPEKIVYSQNLIHQEKYDEAFSLYEAGEYLQAINKFRELDDFKDSKVKVAEIEKLPHRLSFLSDKYNIIIGDMASLRYEISPVTVENTTLTWSSSDERIVAIDDDGVLHALSTGVVEITGTTFNGKSNTCVVEVFDWTIVHVSTAKELLEAINHYTRIVLSPGVYRLSDLPVIENPFVQRQREYVGYSYHINGVDGLEIIGEENTEVFIETTHLYASVLSFSKCQRILIENISFGHVDPPHEYECEGDVLTFNQCSYVYITDSNLYGCGSVGINAQHVVDLFVTQSRIHDCTLYAVKTENSIDVVFDHLTVLSNDLFLSLFSFSDCENVYFLDCIVKDNKTDEYLVSMTRTDVVFIRCGILNNTMKSAIKNEIRLSESKAYFYECTIKDNTGDNFRDDPNAVFEDCAINNNRVR